MGLVFVFDLNVFLCLYSLMKSVGITSAVEDASREFVYNKNFAVGRNDVFLAVMEQLVRL